MSNIGEFLFGSTSEAAHVDNAPTMTGPQSQLLNQLVGLMQGQVGGGVAPYGGQMSAGSSPLQQQAYDQLFQFMGGSGSSGYPVNAQGGGFTGFGNDPTGNPYRGGVIPRGAGILPGQNPAMVKGSGGAPNIDIYPAGINSGGRNAPARMPSMTPQLTNQGATANSGYNPSQFAGQGMQGAMDLVNQAIGQKTNVVGPTDVGGVNLGEYDPTASQQWWKESAMAPAIQNWQENILPGIKEEFISQNAGSSSGANRAIAKSGSDMMANLNSILADKISQERGEHTGRQFQADILANQQNFGAGESYANRALQGSGMDIGNLFQGAGQMGNLGGAGFSQFMSSLNAAGGLGGQQQQTQNALLQGDYTNWLSQQPYNNPWLNMLGPALGSQAFQPVVQGPTSQSGLLQLIAGPTMQGWSSTWGS